MGGADQGDKEGAFGDTLPSPPVRPTRALGTPSHELAFGDTIDPQGGVGAGSGPVAPGSVLRGRYTVSAHLGSGGMGDVYAAHDRLVDQKVALKFVNAALASDSRQRARLRAEVKLAQTVTHVNVARTYTLEEDDGQLFIVMELLEGETLAARLKHGAPPLPEALAIARGLLLGLEAAHARGVVHRDIKPANVKLCSDGRVVVMDFGLARVAESQPAAPLDLSRLPAHTHTALGGTPGYIAPEIVSGGKGDERADLYSFGVVLYELCAGSAPFTADTPLKLIREHVDRPAPDLATERPGVPAHVAAVVRRLLAKDPAERFASASAVLSALEDRPAAAAAIAITPVAPRRSWTWPALGLGVVALAVALVLWLNRPGTHSSQPAPAGTATPPASAPASPQPPAALPPPAATRAPVAPAAAPPIAPQVVAPASPEHGKVRNKKPAVAKAPVSPPATMVKPAPAHEPAKDRRSEQLELEKE